MKNRGDRYRTIAVSHEAYDALVKRKLHPSETFDNVIRRLLGMPVVEHKLGWPKGKKRTGQRGKMAA